MQALDFSKPIAGVQSALGLRLGSDGKDLAQLAYRAASPLLEWTDYLYTSELTGTCDEFLSGLRASIIESIFCTSAGLVRMSMFAMRAQIDIGLSWLYFKDHPVEYARVHKSSEGFMMKSDALKYLQTYYPEFNQRWNKLLNKSTRNEKDPYKLLSAHVHSQSKMTLPSAGNFVDLVWPKESSLEAVIVQECVSEYIGDVFMASFGSKWMNLPERLVQQTKKRLTIDEVGIVFA